MSQDNIAGQKRFLVTMALPYANGDLHLGHVLEAVQTDVYVRYQKLKNNHVVYVCADDTHGTPIELSALKKGITPEALVAAVREDHVRDYAGFNIGFDIFYSTNSDENRTYAELIYKNMQKNGLVIEREIEQYYCEHDARFLPDRFIKGVCPACKAADQYGDVCEVCGHTHEPISLGDPHCVICGKTPVMKRSKHFYVQLAECEEFLRNFVETEGVLQSDMRNFVLSWINDGLKEWCVSRDGPYFGFKIPGTENKFFYVWLDAPIGYISSTERWCKEHGRRLEEYWSKESGTRVIHFIGKDIVYFHALFWPVMLNNSGFSLPTSLFVHGFLNVAGEKMSKSRGTFILAKDYLAKIKHPQAPEYLRFYFGSKLGPSTADIDLNSTELMNKVNTTLANNIGNLHFRTFTFCERYFDHAIPGVEWDGQIAAAVDAAALEIDALYEKTDYKSVVEKVHGLGNLGNKYYQDSKPWELIKTDKDGAARVMVTCANLIKSLAVFLKPITPELAGRIERQLGMKFSWNDYRFSLSGKNLPVIEKVVVPLLEEDIAPLFGEMQKPESAHATGLITIDAFKAIDLRVATIIAADTVEKSNKLLRLQVEIGKEKRQIMAGIAASYKPEELIGKQVMVVANLKPAVLMGHTSEGMVLAAQGKGGGLILMSPEKAVDAGAKIA